MGRVNNPPFAPGTKVERTDRDASITANRGIVLAYENQLYGMESQVWAWVLWGDGRRSLVLPANLKVQEAS